VTQRLLPTNARHCDFYLTVNYVSTEDGEIYVSGWNKNGQLGLASQQVDSLTFYRLPTLPQKFTKVSCGWNHTMALTMDGSVYVWGSNAFGQLGVPEVAKQSESPVQIPTQV
jgi:secretion-regulating guanine nucleotide exchange factor